MDEKAWRQLVPPLDAVSSDQMNQALALDQSVKVGNLPRPANESYIRELTPRRTAEPEISAAQRLVDALVSAGVDTFFGIPGGPISPVFDAILQHPKATLVESRHETSAAFAAADYFRASGQVPAVVVTAGPGATNAVTGIVSAHVERVPMLVICGDVAWASGGGKLLQDSGPEGIAVEKLLANVTRATVRVAQAQTAVAQALAALGAANNPLNPGPALLVVPIHRGRAAAPQTVVASVPQALSAPPPLEIIETAAEWLVDAQHPLIVLGAGCRRDPGAVRRLVDALDIPFVTTPQAKGVVSEAHPRSLRHGGLAASRWARQYTAQGVDVALVLGSDLDDCAIGQTPYVKSGGRLIHVDLDASVFGRNLPTEIGVVADVSTFAEQLRDYVTQNGLRNGRSRDGLRTIKQGSPFEQPDFRRDVSRVITPARALADLEQAAEDDATFISDIGEHMMFAMHYLTARGPDRFTIHLGLGSMGSGISGALGLALARPQRQVICVCGDGGMQMVGMEALVALKHRLPIVYAVFNDARYNMVYHGFKQVFGREAEWETPWTDFAAWARSMGMAGLRINHPGEITRDVLHRLSGLQRPIVLDIRIDRNQHLQGAGRNESLQHMSVLDEPS